MASARHTSRDPLGAPTREHLAREGRRRRRRALMLGLVAVMLLGCETPTRRGPGEVVGRLTATSPDVRVDRSGQSVTYTPNMPLRDGDRVRTGRATYAAIDFTDGNTVYLNVDTGVMLGSIRVLIGEIFNAIVRVGAGSEVYTNDLSAAAEGTMFLLRINPLGTTVTVIEGRVRCAPTAGGAWQPFTLTANQQITGTSRSYSRPMPVDARRAALWVNQAASRLKRPAVLPQPRVN